MSDDARPPKILTTPAQVAVYLAQGYKVVEVHVPGEFGQQLVRMEKKKKETS